jgi:glycosyltransferase involved in cell wall biosynthesis
LAKHLGLSENILFMGSVSNSVVKNYLECADYFISTYDSSNVGNPLLEAISANKIIFTLNNGDTGDWISSGINGFIYDIDDTLLTAMAKDMFNVIQDNKLRAKLIEGVKNTAATKLWSWDERLKAEINAVDSLFIK